MSNNGTNVDGCHRPVLNIKTNDAHSSTIKGILPFGHEKLEPQRSQNEDHGRVYKDSSIGIERTPAAQID